jgi:hypothetical protein
MQCECGGHYEPFCNRCEARRWISVKDKLPVETEDVGFTWDGISISNEDFYDHKRQKWMMIDYENRDFVESPLPISHWMPLPKIPDEVD